MVNNLPPLAGPVDAITATVGDVRDAENDGPLESTDLHVEGRGVSLLVNVKVGAQFTYALRVDGVTTQSGTVGGPVDASGEPTVEKSQKTGRAETRAVVQLAQSFKDDRDDLGITSRAVMARWILDHAAAVPSPSAQEPE